MLLLWSRVAEHLKHDNDFYAPHGALQRMRGGQCLALRDPAAPSPRSDEGLVRASVVPRTSRQWGGVQASQICLFTLGASLTAARLMQHIGACRRRTATPLYHGREPPEVGDVEEQ